VSPAVRAVILERASGQIVMLAVAALSLFYLPSTLQLRGPVAAVAVVAGASLLLGAALVLVRGRGGGPLARVGRDVRDALLARDVVGAQLLTSTLVTASFVAMYVAAARAVHVDTPVATLAPLVPPVLVSMLIPATVAGWGIREATAAGLWSAVGMSAVDGVAASAAYGVLVLVSSLPGALVLLSGGRDRTTRPHPDGTFGTGDGGPDRDPPRPAG
jgi:hypothetical protein